MGGGDPLAMSVEPHPAGYLSACCSRKLKRSHPRFDRWSPRSEQSPKGAWCVGRQAIWQRGTRPRCCERARILWPAGIRSHLAVCVKCRLTDFGRIFGYGGVFDTFFSTNLAQLVDKTNSPVDVASWGSFDAGHTRSVRGGAADPRDVLRDRIAEAGPAVHRHHHRSRRAGHAVLLDVDGQRFEYRRDGRPGGPGAWPGPEPGFVDAHFEDRSGIPAGSPVRRGPGHGFASSIRTRCRWKARPARC